MRRSLPTLLASLASFALPPALAASDSNATIDRYDVVWTSPSDGPSGSMPLGNGDVSLNAWIEPDGDVIAYIGKTDSWDEYGRLLKVGRVRFRFSPPLATTSGFRVTLDVGRGEMRIDEPARDDGAGRTVRVWVDAHHPVAYVTCEGEVPTSASATVEPWRTERETLPSIEVSDVLLDRSREDSQHAPTVVRPDVIIDEPRLGVGWYHSNAESIGPRRTMAIQGLEDVLDERYGNSDPLLHRTFGAIVTAPGGVRRSKTVLDRPAHTIGDAGSSPTDPRFSVWVVTRHPSSPSAWLDAVRDEIAEAETEPFDARRRAHEAYWSEFWSRSWIHVREGGTARPETETDAFVVSRGYQLQRYLNACAGRGAYPIKFNGSIFTVPWPGKPGDADYRRWGPGYWWQNTRLPYIGMCTSGDFDLLRPLVAMYSGPILRVSVERTRRYFGHGGAYFPECVYPWGAVFSEAYGWKPAEERGDDKLQQTGWHKREWVSGLEFAWMLLDEYEHTLDAEFLRDTVIPTAREVLLFFERHYPLGEDGRLRLEPAQALETWWKCTNPMPEVAGLIAVTQRLLALPERLVDEADRERWDALAKKLPDLPVRKVDGERLLAPADVFADKRNVENPELYAVFPFRLIAVGRPDIELGRRALARRTDKGAFGWRQEDIFMAYLGLAEEAKSYVVERAGQKDPASRFPAFWGPNYDWVPDQDHGGILVKAVQAMALQTDGDAIHLLPAWPKGWDVDFMLHAPKRTTVRCIVEDGRIARLTVMPSERRANVTVGSGFTLPSG